jgi:lipopolysaccharide/colanic/teichoic acid biosynthesis glycosyltransferase
MNKPVIRFFDVLFSLAGILVLLPVLGIVALLILLDSNGGVLYRQVRVGRYNADFRLLKFRTMKTDADKSGLITVGDRDGRITGFGYYLRKSKLDELPQLFNVLAGDMSLVGPRPEVRKYVNLYTPEQMKVLSVRPGITDFASIEYRDENALLGKADNPEEVYVNQILPHKIKLNMKFIEQPTLKNYFKVIFKTLYNLVN